MNIPDVASLEAQIRFHNRRYYDLDSPEITDAEYDKLVEQLRKLSPESPVLLEMGKPTFGRKVEHSQMVTSLAKCKTAEEVFAKFRGREIILMPKIDGVSLSLRYAPTLHVAATRGDGLVGEDVTANVQIIPQLPQVLPQHCEVRGEGIIRRSDFYGIMDQPGYDKDYPEGLANPRNAAAGSVRQKDPRETLKRRVRFVAYRMFGPDAVFARLDDRLRWLGEQGFDVPPAIVITPEAVGDITSAIETMKNMLVQLDYDTDGIVIRLNEEEAFQTEGISGKEPRGALAYKFEAETAESVITAIENETSRTGAIIPVAVIKPTHICGSTVSRITLNNWRWVLDRRLGVGDHIKFEKANEIIPHLLGVTKSMKKPALPPEKCPSCGQSVMVVGVDAVCANSGCPAQLKGAVLHVIDKLDIKGIAEAAVDKMFAAGLLPTAWAIFDLTEDQLASAGFGPGQIKNIRKALTSVEAKPSEIAACAGIDMWGRRMFEILMKNSEGVYGEQEILVGHFSRTALSKIPGIGSAKAEALVQGVTGGKWQIVRELQTRVTVKLAASKPATAATLGGKSFCITGTLSRGRSEVEADITAAGGDVKSSVSKNLQFLVAGHDAGSKLDKARALGVQVIGEEYLYEMIAGRA